MFYSFPKIEHLGDITEVLFRQKKDEIKIFEKDDYRTINYVMAENATFPDPCEPGISEQEKNDRAILRECRGIIFDLDGNLIIRSYHKFFNLGEREELSHDAVDFSTKHEVLEKLDGSMLTPLMVRGNLRWATKAGITDISMQAEEFIASRPEYTRFAKALVLANWMPIFEWCSRKNRIVIDHPEDQLILTAIRRFDTGEYMVSHLMRYHCEYFNIPCVRVVHGGQKPISKFIEEDIKNQEGIEGIVIRFQNGHMLKVKSSWYVNLHKTKDDLRHEKNIIKMIMEDQIDDLLPFLIDEDKKKVEKYRSDFEHEYKSTLRALEARLDQIKVRNTSRKDFALNDAPALNPVYAGIIFACWNGKVDIEKALRNVIMKNLGSQSSVEKIKPLIGNIKWSLSGEEDV